MEQEGINRTTHTILYCRFSCRHRLEIKSRIISIMHDMNPNAMFMQCGGDIYQKVWV